jgi:DNA modification methylase
MDGKKADMVFTDPPYGMKKEKEGVLNDNLNYDDLLDFNREWIPLSFAVTKENGSWYCWGIDEPLMDIYSAIIKPMIKSQQATFRNLITWAKGHGQGQNSENTRSYAMADEKCLFVMCGVQGFNNNADNYFEGWEPLRDYLLAQRLKAGWDIPTMKKIAGHSNLSRDHWTCKSQWSMPTREVYQSFQQWGIDNSTDVFKREYDDLKREYDDLKREYYSTRAYFNNTHDNFNNVWEFDRHKRDGSEGGHATPKPIELCERAIKSSSEKNNIVLDFFGGSGSTMIACEKNNRINYSIELDPKYCDVIIKRWQDFTGKQAILESTGEPYGSHT